MANCGACHAHINEEVERTTTRLIASLDDARRAKLVELYPENTPAMTCANCFLPIAAALNQSTATAVEG